MPDTWRRGYSKRKKHNCEERQPSHLRGACNIKAIWMGLIKLGVMVAAAAGAYGLTVSAGDTMASTVDYTLTVYETD